MCNPAVAFVITTALTVYQANEQADAIKEQAAFDAEIATKNQELANQQAADAIERGAADAAQLRQEGERVRAQQMAAFAAAGLDVNVGSTVDVFATTEGLAEADALAVRSNAAREAFGFRTQGVNFGLQARSARITGDNRARATYLNAATQVAGSWYSQGQRTGNYNPFGGGGGNPALATGRVQVY